MWEHLLSRSIWDHPGAVVTLRDPVRRWKTRPALAEGERVTILEYDSNTGQYGPEPRLLVRTESGAERWIDATKVAEDSLPAPLEIIDRSADR
jgi:hypothetical protein